MNSTTDVQHQSHNTELFVFSARSRGALIDKLNGDSPGNSPLSLSEMAFRLATKPAASHRLAIIAKTPASLAARIKQATELLSSSESKRFNLANEVFYGQTEGDDERHKTAFLFSGYGARHGGLLTDLCAYSPAVRDWFDALEVKHRKRFQRNRLLFASSGENGTGERREQDEQEPELCQVLDAILVANLAMFTLMSRLGISCDAMVGHSYGENAVLYAAGLVQEYEELTDLLWSIGEALEIRDEAAQGIASETGMLALSAGSRSLLEDDWIKRSASIFLALDNCPQQAMLCGTHDELYRLEEAIKQRGEMCFRIQGLSHPVHTPMFPLSQTRLRAIYDGIDINPPSVPVYSCSTVDRLSERPDEIRQLLARQWVTPVRFRETIKRLYDDGIRTFVELGSGDRLAGFARDTLRGTDATCIATNHETRGTIHQLQISIANLFIHGFPINLPAILDLPRPDLQPERNAVPTHTSMVGSDSDPVSSERGSGLRALHHGERRRALVDHVLRRASEVMDLSGPELLDPETGFFDLGMNSLSCIELMEKLQHDMACHLPETLAFDYPNAARLADFLFDMLNADTSTFHIDTTPQRKVADAIDSGRLDSSEPIAVIGIGCRFPGGVNSPDDFWQLLLDGRDAITEISPERWDVSFLHGPATEDPDISCINYGGFLDQVDEFDPSFFGISPREAMTLDPQQRLLLEVAWEALENAAIDPQRMTSGRTGVFVGISGNDYAQRLTLQERLDIADYLGTGNASSMAAGRISYVFGFNGPCMAVDTTCSSSLVAVHLACRSLQHRESDAAVAGGVNLLISPETSIYLNMAKALSKDGRCKTFDASADGYVRAEGCGVIVLKRLSDAVAAGDNILAVIRGSAINHDGKTSGLTVPSGPSQEAVVRAALDNAGLTSEDVGYIESHGTGTSLGDPIEVLALDRVFGSHHRRHGSLLLGSVKTNIGHLEAAAGIAGFIKLVLQLQHRRLVPSLHFLNPNPKIDWQKLPFQVCQKEISWQPSQFPLIGAVSSFGMSGTNAHVIVAPAPDEAPCDPSALESLTESRPYHVLTLSGKSSVAVGNLASKLSDHLLDNGHLAIGDVCYSSNTGRAHMPHRLALVVGSRDEALEQLSEPSIAERLASKANAVNRPARPKLAFLFTGQGSHYAGMGRQLFESEPVFRKTLTEADDLLRPLLGGSLLDILFDASTPKDSTADVNRPLDQATYTQPAIFALEYALAKLWQSWGLEPDMVIGHSLGEYAAACVAGVFSLEDGLRLVAARGRHFQSLPSGGSMLAVRASEHQAREFLDPLDVCVSVASVNGPQSIVLSGPCEEIATVQNLLEANAIGCSRLHVSHAFHSSLVDPILGDFHRSAAHVTYFPPQVPLVSNLTGGRADEEIASPDYWTQHLRQTVRFADGVRTLGEEKCEIFLEIGPRPILTALGPDCLAKEEGRLWLTSLHPPIDERRQMVECLGKLYEAGIAVDWAGFHSGTPHRRLPLPTYPFERERYWLDRPSENQFTYETRRPRNAGDGLLGSPSRLPGLDSQTRFESLMSSSTPAFLGDYRLFGHLHLPVAAYLAMAAAAGRQLYASENLAIEELVLAAPLTLKDRAPVIVHTVLDRLDDGRHRFRIFSSPMDDHHSQGDSTLHCDGLIRKLEACPSAPRMDSRRFKDDNHSRHIDKSMFYQTCRQLGFDYGQSFTVLEDLWVRHSEAFGLITFAELLGLERDEDQWRTAMLDGCFQMLGALVFGQSEPAMYTVRRIEQVKLFGAPAVRSCAMASCEGLNDQESMRIAKLTLLGQSDQQTLAEFDGIQFERMAIPDVRSVQETDNRPRTLEIIFNAPVTERDQILLNYLQKLVSDILRQRRDQKLNVHQPFNQMGVDSLLATALSVALQTELAVHIPAVTLLEEHGLATLAAVILSQLDNPEVDLDSDALHTGRVRPLGEESSGWVEGEL